MKVVYIAGPFRGPTEWDVAKNIHEAAKFAYAVAELNAMPLCPHLNTAPFNGTFTARFWLEGTLELMRKCDAVLLMPTWNRSEGARAEKEEATRIGIPVFYEVERLREWLRGSAA